MKKIKVNDTDTPETDIITDGYTELIHSKLNPEPSPKPKYDLPIRNYSRGINMNDAITRQIERAIKPLLEKIESLESKVEKMQTEIDELSGLKSEVDSLSNWRYGRNCW